MNSNRKLALKRLLIFLAIAFVPFYIIIPATWAYFGEPIYASEREDVMITNYIVGVFGMMIPSLSNLITRLVTKEGFGRSYLGLNTKGKLGYWAASVLVPLMYSAVSAIIICLSYLDGISFPEFFKPLGLSDIGLFLMQLAFSVIVFFPAFGEEWGWRGYMMPKLFELMPKPAAVIVGGILWGLWHAPLTVAGHNFGIDYPGYPFVGIGLMCLMCTVLNAFLTLITEKTKSIYPAAFCHAVNNNLGMGIMIMMFGSVAVLDHLDELTSMDMSLLYCLVIGVVGIISFILLLAGNGVSREEQEQEKEAA